MSEPYPVAVVDGVFRFTTDHAVAYSARFLEMPLPAEIQLAGLVFDFSFFPDDAVADNREDARVMATLLHLVRQFFAANPEYILLYICESGDGKHFARQRLFGKWQRAADAAGVFQQLSIEISVAEPAIVGGLLFRHDHPLWQIIADFLRAEIQIYTDVKGAE